MDSRILPEFSELKDFLAEGHTHVPLSKTWNFSDFPGMDPLVAYLKVSRGTHSILWECSLETDPLTLSYSLIATEPWKVLVNGPNPNQLQGNPLDGIQAEVNSYKIPKKYQLQPPILNGGALGYIGYDAVKYFEPKVSPTLSKQEDTLKIPEATNFLVNSFIYFDHQSKIIKIVALCPLEGLDASYHLASERIHELEQRLRQGDSRIISNEENLQVYESVSNASTNGYHAYVKTLRDHIIGGDIIQAVPSQRITKKTGIHPWNIYQRLRTVNPSRYGFFLECDDFVVLGLSPELLVKVMDGQVTTHPIAGTRKRGSTPEEDEALANELLNDEKEQAEHIMLVDLGRNDVNRAAIPSTTKVTSLMHIEKFSHVMHIVSWVTGQLRPECTAFDAYRSIFPAGTVSGAPKIRAIELVGNLEKEKRGIYAGTIGYFSFTGDVDTCIAIRTLVAKNGNVYFQAGGGIVFDSTEEFENEETLSKMRALTQVVSTLETEALQKQASVVPCSQRVDASEISQQLNSLFSNTKTVSVTPNPVSLNAIPTQKGHLTLMIDNYDSFTWNIYQYLCLLGETVVVLRNDKVTVEECKALNPDRLVISPGPGDPTESGASAEIMKEFMGKIPILGVCLGHEVLVHLLGGEIISAGEMKHGKTSIITHDSKGLYAGISEPFSVIRYHSLAANPVNLPKELEVVSTTSNDIIMGVRHKKYRVEGVQYHPESIKTEHGMKLLQNFVEWTTPTWG